jgi:hypothetical protein
MTSVVRWAEVHRLAVAGREARIAWDAGGHLGCDRPLLRRQREWYLTVRESNR